MKKTGALSTRFFLLYKGYMNKKIITTVLVSMTLLLSQGQSVSAMISSDDVVDLVNRERSEANLPILNRSSVLDQAAEAKANDMADENYFSHTSPKGVTPWEWFRQSKYDYRYAGENLAIHFRDSSLEHRAWMESKKHCENIMSPKYLEIGVAVREMKWEGKQTTIAVQMFGTQMIDEKKLNISEQGNLVCPKRYPSVLGASLPADNNGGVVGSVAGLIADVAMHFRIDTNYLLALVFFAGAQMSGLFVILLLATRNQWIGKW